jgi:hypothetical protein
MKKLILSILTILIIMSCENETNVNPTSYQLKFKFYETPNVNSRNSEEEPFELKGTILVNGEELSLISDELEMTRAINQETGQESYVIHRKSNSDENFHQRTGGPRIEFGYFYDGYDCWIAGTWYHGDNGQSIFVPGSASTQYLNNICGWSNVA